MNPLKNEISVLIGGILLFVYTIHFIYIYFKKTPSYNKIVTAGWMFFIASYSFLAFLMYFNKTIESIKIVFIITSLFSAIWIIIGIIISYKKGDTQQKNKMKTALLGICIIIFASIIFFTIMYIITR